MIDRTYLKILKIGIFLSLISVLLFFKGLFFPFITSKQIFFNVLIEILFVFWAVFLIKYPFYRPQKSWISRGLLVYFGMIFLSCFFSVDFNLSFWGDAERMLGFFHLFHFLIFYFILITVLRTKKEWYNFFSWSVILAFILSIYGLAVNVKTTIGNTAYVSAYLIFNIYFALLLLWQKKGSNLKWLYVLSLIPMLLEFKAANTSGAIVGLGFSIFVFFFLIVLLGKNKKIKIFSLASLILAITLASFLFVNRDVDFVKNNSVLRVFHDISFQKSTFQTRLISWRAAWADFKNHPIIGVGHGNYSIIFDKYFDPIFYTFTKSETYFDRAHNNLIDIASTTGSFGLLAYLSVFLAVAYYLIKGYQNKKIGSGQFILISSLLSAYFVQNLAVFDSLVTYISLMMVLAYVYFLTQEEENLDKEFQNNNLKNKEIHYFLGIGFLVLIIIFQFNIKPLKAFAGVVDAQMTFHKEGVSEGVEKYENVLSAESVLDRDVRINLIRLIFSNLSALNTVDEKEQEKIINILIREAEKNIEYNPKDSLSQQWLAQIFDLAATFHAGDNDKFRYYGDKALETMDKAIAASPGRVRTYFAKAQINMTRREIGKAIETINFAISLNKEYSDGYCQLGKIYLVAGDKEKGYENINLCVEKGGINVLIPASFVKQLINHYVDARDDEMILALYQHLSTLEPENSKVWVNLAKLEAEAGNKKKAEKAALKAAELDESLAGVVEQFISGLWK